MKWKHIKELGGFFAIMLGGLIVAIIGAIITGSVIAAHTDWFFALLLGMVLMNVGIIVFIGFLIFILLAYKIIYSLEEMEKTEEQEMLEKRIERSIARQLPNEDNMNKYK